jgi:hypothetical protein
MNPFERRAPPVELKRWMMAVGIALFGAGCADTTPDVIGPPQASVPAEIEAVTQAIALGMAQPSARHAVRDAMRASPITDHKLLFQEYAASAAAEPLLRAAAAATGTTPAELRTRIAALPALDFFLPAEKQRLTWQGGSDYMVTWSLAGDPPPRVAYGSDGTTRAFDVTKERPPEAVFFIESAERTSPRIDRQPDVPGLTIQDPGDGTLSGSVLIRDKSGISITVNLVDWKHVQPRLQECLPEDCGGGGGGGGDPPPPPPPPPDTRLERIITSGICDNNDCDHTNEFDFRALKSNGTTEVLQLEGVGSYADLTVNRHLIYALPPMLVGGECTTSQYWCGIAARERDSWPDPDDLWFFSFTDAQGAKCEAIPLGSNVGGYFDDRHRLFTLQEDETCQSPPNPPLHPDWRLEVSFIW